MRHLRGVTGLAAVVALALMAPAIAQDASDFRLPAPSPSSSPRAQGPTDPDNPVLVVPRATPGPTASAAPPPVAGPTPLVTETSATGTPTGAARPVSRPGTSAAGNAAPAAAPRLEAAPGSGIQPPPLVLPSDVPLASPGFDGPSTPSVQPDLPLASGGTAWWWPYVAGLAGLLALGFAIAWWRRRRESAEPVVTFEPPVVAPQPAPLPERAPLPSLAEAIPEPALGLKGPTPDKGLTLALEAQRLSASLVATTLNYRLVLTNHGRAPLSALAIEGDMVSAHASLPPDQQIAQPTQRLELRHALSTLAPGESAEFSGDIRLPLAAVTPIRAGEAAYFVPLARFRVEAGEPGGHPVVLARTFVIGEVARGSGAALRPFRLDLGPRVYSLLDQRPVN